MSAQLDQPMPAVPLSAAWRRSGVSLLLVLLAIGWAYFDTFRAMVLIWHRSETFAHAFVVPPIALWLIWRQREPLLRQWPAPAAGWLLALVVLGGCWLLGQMMAVNAVTQLCATASLIVAVPLVLGWRATLVILFPLLYLFFAVPIGEFMIPPLMQSTADFTVAALRLSGVPVYREGLQFVIPSGNWSVVEACSGVRYLMASFMVGSLFAYLNYRSQWRRLVFCIVSLLVPVLANWVRAYMIVMLGHLSSNRIAAGADHLIYGWVFFGVVITGVFMIGARWSEAPAPPAPASLPSAADSGAEGATGGVRGWVVAGLAAVIVLLPALLLQRFDAWESATPARLRAPAAAAGWQVESEAPGLWRPAFRNPSSESLARFTAQDGRRVGVYLAYYRTQGEGHKVVSSDNTLVHSSDNSWNPVESEARALALAGAPLNVQQTRLLQGARSGGGPRRTMLAWQFYWVNGDLAAQDLRAKLLGAWHRLHGRGDESAAVVLFAEDEPSLPAEAALESFVRENLGTVTAELQRTRDAR